MTLKLMLKVGVVVLVAALVVVGAAYGLAPALPGAGQLGFSSDTTFYVLDVARGLRFPLLHAASVPPQWSPDGQQMVFVRHNGASPYAYDSVVVSNAFAGSQRVLYPSVGPAGFVDQRPTWSPFNRQIAFTYGRAERQKLDLVVLQPDVGASEAGNILGVIPLTTTLAWTSADRMRYVTAAGGKVRLDEVRLPDFMTSIVREWSFDLVSAHQAVLSSDGQRFILPAITVDTLNFEIYLFDAQSGEVRNLSNRPAHNDSGAVWSPDDQHILFRSMNDAGHFLVLIDADGSHPTTVAHDKSALYGQVAWSPDGQRASFVVSQTNDKQLCIVEIASGVVTCPADGVDDVTWRPMPSSG